MTFSDHFSGSKFSTAYAAFRPDYPDALFEFLAREAPARDEAWDVGCGTGQAAVGLARHFKHVIATDPSATQIEAATPHPGVNYRIGRAEQSELDDASVDLVAVAQALHWFDRPRFWTEARRVLRPRGLVAIWTYVLFEISPEIDAVVGAFYSGVVGPYWPPERRLVDGRYQSIDFPFAEFQAPSFTIERELTLNEVAGYVRTWSATRAFIKHNHQDPVEALVRDLSRAWGPSRVARRARWPVTMRVGRVA